MRYTRYQRFAFLQGMVQSAFEEVRSLVALFTNRGTTEECLRLAVQFYHATTDASVAPDGSTNVAANVGAGEGPAGKFREPRGFVTYFQAAAGCRSCFRWARYIMRMVVGVGRRALPVNKGARAWT